VLATNLKPGRHEVLVRKLTEAFFGVVSFMGFLQSDGHVVFNSPSRNVRCELSREPRETGGVVVVTHTAAAAAVMTQQVANRRIEAMGASFTCGYGVEGHHPCGFTPYTENYSKCVPSAVCAVSCGASTLPWLGLFFPTYIGPTLR
jgi:hypothetical protein